ncbi:hypothetical protein GCM10028803_46520 [Larkinella knui]|uniref:Serine protease n=2 Tax=Larkinella knui TaxID=2025310 RepID=A0A3P1CPQ9_9BACT|nr:serine protease [Larkinella knui]
MLVNRLNSYQKLEELRQSKLIVYVTGDRPGLETQISPEILEYFVRHLDNLQNSDKISLFLYTRGGDTMAAWSLINLIKQFCKEFEVIIPSKARSAGTLISLGANKIVMTKQATLGPIDPSLNTPLNPQNPAFPQNPQARLPVSVESIRGYIDLAKQELGVQSENNLTNIFLHLSNFVHPLVLGDTYRVRTQIKTLSRKLVAQHTTDGEQIEKIVSFLCSDSGSHDYPIYRREARDELGLNIEKPNDELYSVIDEVFTSIQEELELLNMFDIGTIVGNHNSVNYSFRRVLIESIVGGTDVFVSEGMLIKSQFPVQPQFQNGPATFRTVFEDNRTFEGWKYEPSQKQEIAQPEVSV